jgi:hypothetical protein
MAVSLMAQLRTTSALRCDVAAPYTFQSLTETMLVAACRTVYADRFLSAFSQLWAQVTFLLAGQGNAVPMSIVPLAQRCSL